MSPDHLSEPCNGSSLDLGVDRGLNRKLTGRSFVAGSNPGSSSIISMESSHTIWSRRHVGASVAAAAAHSCVMLSTGHKLATIAGEPTRGKETPCPGVVRSTGCDRWAVSYTPGVSYGSQNLKCAGQSYSCVRPVAAHPTDSGRFRGVLFPNPFPSFVTHTA